MSHYSFALWRLLIMSSRLTKNSISYLWVLLVFTKFRLIIINWINTIIRDIIRFTMEWGKNNGLHETYNLGFPPRFSKIIILICQKSRQPIGQHFQFYGISNKRNNSYYNYCKVKKYDYVRFNRVVRSFRSKVESLSMLHYSKNYNQNIQFQNYFETIKSDWLENGMLQISFWMLSVLDSV